MGLATLLFLALLGSAPTAAGQASETFSPNPILIEIGAGASASGRLLDLLITAPDQEAAAAEREMADALSKKPWLRVVSSKGEAAVAVSRTRRVVDTRSESKDGKQTTIRFKYVVSAGIAIRGDRGAIEAETIVTRNYSTAGRQQSPSRSEDRDAFGKVGRELASKAREWILPRIAVLRPEGPDAGFQHKAKFKFLLKGDGLAVVNVAPGSAAERAGLRAGDRIRRIDRETGTVPMDERAYTFRLDPPGTVVAIEVERGQQRSTIALTLGSPWRSAEESTAQSSRRPVAEPQGASRAPSRVAGTASGTLTLNGKSVPLRHAYAMVQPNTFDASKRDTAVLLTEKPLPEGAIDGIGDLQEATHELIRGRKHEGMAYFKINSAGKPIYELIDHPALLNGQHRQIQMSGFTHANFAPKQMGPERAEGAFVTSKPEDFMSYKYEIKVEFSAPLMTAKR